MAYQALYRQWRPKDFKSMVAQEAVIETLRNQVASGRIAHAYLFCGCRGTGKTSSAKILARAVNCENPDRGNPCGECETCRRLLADENLDVTEIDAASNNGVDDIRLLRDGVQYPPQYCRYKVYIIDEVHMLSASAFNALLKTLEEPPEYCIFILATTEPQKLPATVLSRCQRYDFGRIPAVQIVGRLREAANGAGVNATDGALMRIARAAEGAMRDALSILDMCIGYGADIDEALVHRVLGTSDRAFLFRFAEGLRAGDTAALLRMTDELMRTGREVSVFAKDVSEHLRALLMARFCPSEIGALMELTPEDAKAYIDQSAGFTNTRLMNMLEIFMAVETSVRYSSSPRIALESAVLKASLRTVEHDPTALLDAVAELKKQVETLEKKLAEGEFTAKQVSDKPLPGASLRQQLQGAVNVKKAAPPPMSPTGLKPDQAWKQAVGEIGKVDGGVWSLLGTCQFLGCDGSRFICTVEGEPVRDILNRQETKKLISDALTRAMGVPCDFTAQLPESKQPVWQGSDDYLQELTATFGSDTVLVQDEPLG